MFWWVAVANPAIESSCEGSIFVMSAAKQAGATSLGMQSENFGYSRVRLRRIKKLQFGVVDPNELVSFHCFRRGTTTCVAALSGENERCCRDTGAGVELSCGDAEQNV